MTIKKISMSQEQSNYSKYFDAFLLSLEFSYRKVIKWLQFEIGMNDQFIRMYV